MAQPTYGDIEGVRALLPGRRITDSTPTKPAHVERFLDTVGHQINARMAERLAALELMLPPHEAELLFHFRQAARSLAELGAAAMVEDAGFPERAAVNVTDTSYGAVLWARYREGLDTLVAATDAELERRRTLAHQVDASPAVSSPDPTFRLNTRF